MNAPGMIPKDAKILITGATGFIGSRLVEVLHSDGHTKIGVLVRGLKNASRIARFAVDFHPGDLTDAESLLKATKGCDIVFNLAYDFGARNDQKRAVSAAGAENLARAVVENKVERLVHFSTISAYGDTKDGPLTEASQLEPTEDLYGLSKRDADDVFVKWYEERGLPVAILQPTIVYGPFSKPWTHGPLGQLTSGVVVLPNGGSGLCDCVYVDDVAQAALLAASKPGALGQKFMISGPEPVTWKSFYAAYEKMLGRTATLCVDEAQIQALSKNPKDVAAIRTKAEPRPKEGVVSRLFSRARPKEVLDLATERLLNEIEAGKLPLHLPSPARLSLLKSKTHVIIEKAIATLGYSPRYDLARGMELNRAYAEWANLLPTPERSKGVVASVAKQAGAVSELLRLRADRKTLLRLKNRYAGRRCFIIGNGPSLKKTNTRLLKDEITIGCNGIFLMFEEMGFLPTFFTVEDILVAEDRAKWINPMRGTTKIFPADLSYCLTPDENTIYVNFIRPGYKGFPKFSAAFEDEAYWGGTVTFLNLQLAYFLGCSEVYLVGLDHSYRAKNAADEQQGFTITARTPDPNHFHPDYFGPGFRYHDPNVDRMEVGYKKAKEFTEARGVRIFNATNGGMLEVFPRVDFDSLFQGETVKSEEVA